MLKRLLLITIVAMFGVTLPCLAQEPTSNPVTLKGLYMGQKVPGSTPVLFAEGFVSTPMNMHGNIVFSPDLSEAFWHPDEPKGLYFSRIENGVWTKPIEVSFVDGQMHDAPCYSHDGRRLLFSAAPLGASGKTENEKFYCVDRQAEGWSEARSLDTVFDAFSVHWQFSVDSDDNLYFGGNPKGADTRSDIWLSRYENGKYTAPTRLPAAINTENGEFSPCIAPDGSYLIFNRAIFAPNAPPRFSLFVSFRAADGSWGEAQGLDTVTGSNGSDLNAKISPDGKFLFFLSQRGASRGTYWVDAAILDALRPGKQ